MAAIIHRITNKSAFNRLLITYLNSAGVEYTANIGPGDNEPKEFCGQQYSFKFKTIEERSGNPPIDAQEYNDYTVIAGSTCDAQPPGNSAGTGGTTPIGEVNTKFKLRLISTNTAGSKQTNVLNGVRIQSGEVVEFDAKNFRSGISVQPEYDSNAFNLLTTNKRFELQGDSTLFIYTITKGSSGESSRSFDLRFIGNTIIEETIEFQPTTSPPQNNTDTNVVIQLNGNNGSAVARLNDGSDYTLNRGTNSIPAKLGNTIDIFSSNDSFRATNIIARNTSGADIYNASAQSPTDSVSLRYTVNAPITVFVDTENFVAITENNIPGIEFTNGNSREYNINSDSGIAFSIRKLRGTNKITASVGGRIFTFSNLGDGEDCIIILSDDAFPKPGQYKVILTPSNDLGGGDSIEGSVNAFADFWVGIPDIRDIVYPSVLRGPDYIGTDVDFEISYKSVNTDLVRIYKDGSDKYIEGPSSGVVKLNVQQILDLDSTTTSEDEDKISFTLKLIPYNLSGLSPVIGKHEIINILFDKGDLLIRRPLALNRIIDGFINQFDLSVFEDETSKYLTHLLHLGDGENKVITTWTPDRGSLILKLYEPLPLAYDINQLVWISKPQANPIIETVTLKSEIEDFCPPLKGPNFNLGVDKSIGFRVFDDLVASGSFTSNDIVNKYLESNGIDTSKLNISYASGSNYLFNNFVNFSSAEERVNNFFYKVELIENYKEKYTELIADTFTNPYIDLQSNLLAEYQNPNSDPFLTIYSSQNDANLITEETIFDLIQWEINQPKGVAQLDEAKKVLEKANVIIRAFDGFEKWLYNDLVYSNTLSYPKTIYTHPITGLVTNILKPTTDNDVISWYENLQTLAAEFDKYNPNYLVNNIPEFVVNDYDNNDFITFLDMIGQHFDIIWSYVNGLKRLKVTEEQQVKGATNNLIYYLLESMGWDGKRAFDSSLLWEYAFGTDRDGFQKYGMPLADANNQVWKRILNNLPYLLKHKGTGRAMKAVMACYGVPQSMLTIMEFGGPQDPTKEGSTKFTFDDRTAAIKLQNNSSVVVPWKSVNSSYPQGIEFRIKPNSVQTTRIISGSQFYLDIEQTTGSFATLKFAVDTTGVAAPYIETPFASGSPSVSTTYFSPLEATYVIGPETISGSNYFPLSTEHYSNVLINRYPLGGESSRYEINLKTSDGERIITSVSMSFVSEKKYWETGSNIIIGNDFDGNLDEFRLWRVPLQPSKLENHTLHPDAINGNSYTASTADLLFRLDFEYVKNRTITENAGILNVAINTTYGENYATASLMYSASTYPYQYEPYDRTVTATVPSLGLNYSNKIRFEEQELVTDLSYRVRATKKSFDRASVDSNRLGLFMSPIKELNMDIVRAFGDFNIDNYIGDPSDDYKDSYRELAELRKYYFQRLNRNIYEYIQLVRYIDKSLFDVLDDLAPARAKVSKGLLIEPHYLERSKTKWEKPQSVRGDYDTSVDTNINNKIELSYETKDALLDATDVTTLVADNPNYDTLIDAETIYSLDATNPNYESEIDTNEIYVIESTYPTYPQTGSINIECPTGATLTGEVDSFTTTVIGLDPNSLANAGFGLYAESGNGIVRTIEPVFGNFEMTGSRKSIFLVKEEYKQSVSTQLRGYPTTRSLTIPNEQVYYENMDVTKYRYKVSTLPFSGSINIGNDTIEVVALNGYFPTHYKFVNNLSEGMQRSYWKGSIQNATTTPDGLDPVETFTTNPNILKVANTGRGSGEPILVVE
jgi:hypothetical protein